MNSALEKPKPSGKGARPEPRVGDGASATRRLFPTSDDGLPARASPSSSGSWTKNAVAQAPTPTKPARALEPRRAERDRRRHLDSHRHVNDREERGEIRGPRRICCTSARPLRPRAVLRLADPERRAPTPAPTDASITTASATRPRIS